MIDIDAFSEDQKKTLALILGDVDGPTSVPTVLYMIENIIYGLKPDWALDAFADNAELRADIEVCMAALQYVKMRNVLAKD